MVGIKIRNEGVSKAFIKIENTRATSICNAGDFVKKGVLIFPHYFFFLMIG
jgi:hypothetical protein